ncbi:MAG: DNRLRE domain-containing protein [Planctomycetes bacterium]|nr:DNRLRE domain-containing protein [Planctomycetota bacterium]
MRGRDEIIAHGAAGRPICGRPGAAILLLCLALGAGTGRAQHRAEPLDARHPYQGIAVLSSSVEHSIRAAEIESFVAAAKIDLVVIDFAWITHNWPRTDLAAVERLAAALCKAGVATAAMYRPRALRPDGIPAHFARGPDGAIAPDHNELCFAHDDSVAWGASWGEKILAACPSLDRILLYNVRASCACEQCRGPRGREHVGAFFAACRARWDRIRPGVRIGHVDVELAQADRFDFLCPFLAVNRAAADRPVEAERLVEQTLALRARARGKPVLPLVKICWADATRNTTEDVVNIVRKARERKLGFLLWYYEWIFHPEDDRYDPLAIAAALGADRARVEAILARGAAPPAVPGKGGRWWVYFPSRESTEGSPPALVLHLVGEPARRIPASRDTALLRYLGERAFGALPTLPVGLEDENRSLLAFELPKSMRAASLERAELVLDLKLSPMPPARPFRLAVHAVEGVWTEAKTNWNDQPPCAKEAALTVEVAAKPAPLALDLTELVRGWLAGTTANHGVVLKQADARGDLFRQLLETLPWETDARAAVQKAAKLRRPILASVRGARDASTETVAECVLLAVAFADPDVVELVRRRFVPLRVACSPASFAFRQVRGGPDPLKPLGADSTEIKPPALLVASPAGALVAALESLGTFDAELVHRFLLGALERSARPSRAAGAVPPEERLAAGDLEGAERAFRTRPRPERDWGLCRVAARRGDHALAVRLAHEVASASPELAADASVQGGVSLMRLGDFERASRLLVEALGKRPAPARAAEALYYLGSLAARQQQPAQAEAAWSRLAAEHPQSLWALKAAARRQWPDRIGPAENLRSLPLPAGRRATTELACPAGEQAALVRRAIGYLLEQQAPDGSWPVEAEPYRAGVTALVAKALLVWSDRLGDAELEAQAKAGMARATDWIVSALDHDDPKSANSFGAAYLLDFLLARHARSQEAAARHAVERAIPFLLAGQCPGGAWSYSHRFNATWRGGFGGWPVTDKGRVHSVNTGPALLFLARAKASGFGVDEAALARAAKVLETMRVEAGVYTYTYPEPLNFREPDQSIARGPVCEHALWACGTVGRASLTAAVQRFLKYRADLRIPVKLDGSWGNPHAFSSYFYFFAYYHAALAAEALGTKTAAPWLKALRDDLLAVPELDATWVDYHQVGKPYGTAVALLVLALG